MVVGEALSRHTRPPTHVRSLHVRLICSLVRLLEQGATVMPGKVCDWGRGFAFTSRSQILHSEIPRLLFVSCLRMVKVIGGP